MGPRRKKTKHTAQPEDKADNHPDTPQSDNSLQHKTPQGDDQQAKSKQDTSQDKNKQDAAPLDKKIEATQSTGGNSWYKGGSWRSKASPVAQATRESISVAGGATSEALSEGAKQTGRYVHNSLRRSTKSYPSISSESIVYATGSNSDAGKPKTPVDKPKRIDDKPKSVEDKPKHVEDKTENKVNSAGEVKLDDTENAKQINVKDKRAPAKGASTIETVQPGDSTTMKTVKPGDSTTETAKPRDSQANQLETADLKPLPAEANTQQSTAEPPLPPEPAKDGNNSNAGWLGWWSRPDGYTDNTDKTKQQDEHVQASTTPLPATPAVQTQDKSDFLEPDRSEPARVDTLRSARSVETAASSRSWFRLWSSTQNLQTEQEANNSNTDITPTNPPETDQVSKSDAPPADPPAAAKDQVQQGHDTNMDEAAAPLIKEGEETPRNNSSGWAFWSRDKGKDEAPTPNGTQRRVGELAVADTPSQSHPEAAQFNEEPQKAKSTKAGRSASLSSNASLSSPSQTRMQVSDATKTDAKSLKPQLHPNLVIPSFSENFSAAYIPSYWERAATYLASSLRIIETPGQANHVHVSPTIPKIKSAIAIGVHGYFPAPLIQRVLGQPTGTSIRFANHASAAVRKWVETNQPDIACDIETVALEGEGFIADRVATLWKLLLNWLSHLRQADLILVACHSQGVPVAIMLVNKLINLGCLSPHVKVGICAMAGVNLGPFADYKSRLLGQGAAAELFEFSRPGSKVSLEYAAALDGVLRHNVRITYCGSIDDQLVSLESSLFTTLSHPHIYRAVFVDGRLHAPNFLTNLVAFASKLRNLGVSDHGLIRELSLPLAGSLYGGEGHSRIYDESAVYDLAMHFTLETTDVLPNTNNIALANEAAERRSSRGGPGGSVSAANALRRGSVSSSTLPGIGPIMLPYEVPASGSNANPYFLPWALRGILEEDIVKRDMQDEVQKLVRLYEEWRPQSKVLKDVKFRLEGVRSKL